MILAGAVSRLFFFDKVSVPRQPVIYSAEVLYAFSFSVHIILSILSIIKINLALKHNINSG